jgi:multiple sugar transport system ATP-binding protein
VAGFLGDPPMNFIPCTLKKKGKGFELVHPTFSFDLPDSVSSRLPADLPQQKRIDLGVRPESFILHKEKPSAYQIEGKVYITEPLGEDIIIDVTIGDDRVKAKTVIGFQIDVDQPVYMQVKFERIHLFDAETEQSLLVK